MIGRFFVATFVFVIAILHDFFHGILTKEEFKKGWPMYVSYVKTGNWMPMSGTTKGGRMTSPRPVRKKHRHRYRFCRMSDGTIMPGCRQCCRCGKAKP